MAPPRSRVATFLMSEVIQKRPVEHERRLAIRGGQHEMF
jgi:hypothetical protein